MQNSRQWQVDIETQKLFRQNTIYNSFRLKNSNIIGSKPSQPFIRSRPYDSGYI